MKPAANGKILHEVHAQRAEYCPVKGSQSVTAKKQHEIKACQPEYLFVFTVHDNTALQAQARFKAAAYGILHLAHGGAVANQAHIHV